ncbi:MAG: Enolase, C-terminal barrel domain [Cyanobacteriota bacterium]|jgi:enolase
MSHRAGYTCMVSHRSVETPDDCIADLVVGAMTGRSSRVALPGRASVEVQATPPH